MTNLIKISRFNNASQHFCEHYTTKVYFSLVTLASTLHYLVWVMYDELAHSEHFTGTLKGEVIQRSAAFRFALIAVTLK